MIYFIYFFFFSLLFCNFFVELFLVFYRTSFFQLKEKPFPAKALPRASATLELTATSHTACRMGRARVALVAPASSRRAALAVWDPLITRPWASHPSQTMPTSTASTGPMAQVRCQDIRKKVFFLEERESEIKKEILKNFNWQKGELKNIETH